MGYNKRVIAKLNAERALRATIGTGEFTQRNSDGIQLKRSARLSPESDFDPWLPSQVYDKKPFRKPSTGEERMAWRLLERNILDACQGKKRARLAEIASMRAWIAAGEDANYPFGYWCTLLGVDEGFMRDKFGAFLTEQTANAERGIRGDFKILRQIEAVRIDSPHRLARCGPDCPGAPFLGLCEHGQFYPHSVTGGEQYMCVSCGRRGDWKHFLGYTCVRGWPESTNALERLADAAMREYEEGHSEPLHVGNEYLVRDQGSLSDPELDHGNSSERWADDGGAVCSSGVGAVVARPAA